MSGYTLIWPRGGVTADPQYLLRSRRRLHGVAGGMARDRISLIAAAIVTNHRRRVRERRRLLGRDRARPRDRFYYVNARLQGAAATNALAIWDDWNGIEAFAVVGNHPEAVHRSARIECRVPVRLVRRSSARSLRGSGDLLKCCAQARRYAATWPRIASNWLRDSGATLNCSTRSQTILPSSPEKSARVR